MNSILRNALALAGLAITTQAAAQIVFYENDDFRGRSFTTDKPVGNFEKFGFNDRASSLRVESGYWIFCSDSEFRGNCRTYGPGDYASLPGMNNVISSGRRIANDYPYEGKPDWQRDSYPPSQGYQNRTQ